MNQANLLRRSAELAELGTPFVLVTLVEATGSTPSDTGAKMLVTANGLEEGTVGGGRVEAKAIAEAQSMLEQETDHLFVKWNLKADVGMTCGGTVQFFFERPGWSSWKIVIFGAGHVTQALTRLLVTLPCQVTCIDPRPDWLSRLPGGIQTIETCEPPSEVCSLSENSFVLCMTQGHKSDLPVLLEIFKQGKEFDYLGVIGSKTKAAVLRKELADGGIQPEQMQFHCPIGLPIGTNHPGEIAISIAAQLLEARDKLMAKTQV